MPNINEAISSPSPQVQMVARTLSNVSQEPAEAAAATESLVSGPGLPFAPRLMFLRRLGLEPVAGYRANPRSELSTLIEQRGEESAEQAAEEADFIGARDAVFGSRAGVAQETPEFLGAVLTAISAVSTGIRVGRAIARAVRGETAGIAPEQPRSLVEVVIGEDDRTRVPDTVAEPFSGICQLNIRSATGRTFRGSGLLISPRCVITAGHCVYMDNEGGWATSITVAPGRDANMYPYEPITSERFASTNEWVTSAERDFDYAAIFLPRPFTPVNGTAPYQFDYASLDDSQLREAVLNCAGYSADDPATGKDGTVQWFHARRATRLTTSRLEYDADAGGGASGHPVYIVNPATGARTCVGLQTNGFSLGNSCARITADMAASMDQWRQASET